jgi:hypothetical protein
VESKHKTHHEIKGVICLIKTYGELIKSKENLAKNDYNISDSEVEARTSKNSVEQKEQLDNTTRSVKNKKTLREISMSKSINSSPEI